MASRPLPPPLPTLPCCGCSGRFGLEYDGRNDPVAYHTVPYCEAFNAIGNTVDAITHWEKSKEKKVPA